MKYLNLLLLPMFVLLLSCNTEVSAQPEFINTGTTYVIPAKTTFETTLETLIDSSKSKIGDNIELRMNKSYIESDTIVIPYNSIFVGKIKELTQNSIINSSYYLVVEITSFITPFGKSHPFQAHFEYSLKDPAKKGHLFKFDSSSAKTKDVIDKTGMQKNNTNIQLKPLFIDIGTSIPLIIDGDNEVIINRRN